MRIDFSEPECSKCYYCRTSGILNTQESERSNVIGSSVTSMPISSGPVQALGNDSASVGLTSSLVQPLGHESAAVGSTSTSSPVHTSSPFSFDSASAATTSVSSGLGQSLPTFSNFGVFGVPSQGSPFQVTFGSSASATSTSSTSSPVNSSSPLRFGSALDATSGSSAPTQALSPNTFSFGTSAASTPPRFGSMQAPVQATFGSGASSTSTSLNFLPFGSVPAPPQSGSSLFGPAQDMPWATNPSSTGCGIGWVRPDVGVLPASSSSTTTTVVFGTTPVSVSSLVGPAQDFSKTTSLCASSTGKTPLNSFFPGFGVGSLPGSSSNLYGSNSSTTIPVFGTGSIPPGVKASSPQPFGFNGATTLLPRSPFSSSTTCNCSPNIGFNRATTYSKPNIGSHPFASHEWSRRTEQGSRYPGYAPTPDGQNGDMYISISASNSYLHKNHEELRWEDYKQGVKGGSFPAARVSPFGARPNAVISPSTASPSIFASPSVPDHPQGNKTSPAFAFVPAGGDVTTSSPSGFGKPNAPFIGFGTQFPSSSSSSSTDFPVHIPHETAAVSSPASGCTACGATTSSSASGYFNINGATAPPSSATSLPGLFLPTFGSGPMMFGTYLAPQGTTPALQAYPVQGFILLPFAAMSLQ